MLSGNLEYLMSSLPDLMFDNSETYQKEVSKLFKTYNSADEASQDLVLMLHAEAEKFLSTKEFNDLKALSLKAIHQERFQNNSQHVIASFSRFNHQMKREVQRFREHRKNEDLNANKLNFDILPELSNNPLKAEEQLLKLQWDKLEELSIGHYSDLAALFIYKLKLELLVRWWSFNEEVGLNIFKQTLKMEVYG
ncbi:DUF2764 family protein [uncultured Winogradskyella sp.]|uniref:DUF2764 family protein n=1 Tax=uncultured Winogradskyella sp. TaxID=395353 RepID=UPI003518B31A